MNTTEETYFVTCSTSQGHASKEAALREAENAVWVGHTDVRIHKCVCIATVGEPTPKVKVEWLDK